MVEFILQNYVLILQVVAYVVAGASAAAALLAPLTKNVVDDRIASVLKKLLALLNLVAINPKQPAAPVNAKVGK